MLVVSSLECRLVRENLCLNSYMRVSIDQSIYRGTLFASLSIAQLFLQGALLFQLVYQDEPKVADFVACGNPEPQ